MNRYLSSGRALQVSGLAAVSATVTDILPAVPLGCLWSGESTTSLSDGGATSAITGVKA